ncbi:hypothetical protein Y882_08415 [Dyella japonica DSM 16301]|uniref:Uncharacterized protein n=1 Tax=Dyella japonica DSM 16301 TaxID=1440762 RepID=A0A0G9H3L3_9GAMM|nr:hypothetical protein Y882_08415 [Dyella japonica DSM 16301]
MLKRSRCRHSVQAHRRPTATHADLSRVLQKLNTASIGTQNFNRGVTTSKSTQRLCEPRT